MCRMQRIFLIIGLATLFGCSPDHEEAQPVAAPEGVRAESWRESRILAGEEIYGEVCATCHDTGEGGAPVTGDRSAWSARSDLWTAILAEHAANGYLEMPEKGGHSELSDDDVSAAAEYMLQQTFPELPRD